MYKHPAKQLFLSVYVDYLKVAGRRGEHFWYEARLQLAGRGFGLHLVNVTNHRTTGGMSTAEVEAQFAAKLGSLGVRVTCPLRRGCAIRLVAYRV